MASAVSGLAPSLTAVPTVRISSAISRPCRAIQALCHISMTTAMPSTLALNSSWPAPSKACEMAPANMATTAAPTMPAQNADADPAPAPVDAARRRHHDADDQAGLDDFAKHNDQGAEHGL